MKNRLLLAVLLFASTSYGMGFIRAAISNVPPAVVVTNAPPAPEPPAPPPPPVVTNAPATASDLDGLKIKWPSGQDVSKWPATVQIKLTDTTGNRVAWKETGDRDTWKVTGKDKPINANIWTLQPTGNGGYKAETFDFLAKGDHDKDLKNLHVNDLPKGWGVMIAGVTRDPKMANVKKRSNVDWVK